MNHIVSFLDKLICESFGLLALSENNKDSNSEFQRMFTRWKLSARQVLEHAGLDQFLQAMATVVIDEETCSLIWIVQRISGILESARECLQGNVTGKLKYLLHAELFDSVVGQAKGLLEAGHRIPSAVLARIVIEGWLRDSGEKANIPDWESAKASVIAERLKTAGVFPTGKWRMIQSLLDTGNAAAHGKVDEFDDADVQRMIVFAEANCV